MFFNLYVIYFKYSYSKNEINSVKVKKMFKIILKILNT